jgi:hypothetical protein
MGKFANAQAWREYEAKRDRELDAHLDPEEPLTEFEKAAEWDDERWQKADYPRTDRHFGGGFA